jgi:hypothetical protein
MDEILYLVPLQGELPTPKKILKVKDAIDGKENSFKVKSIVDLEWNKNNCLICTLKGEYV